MAKRWNHRYEGNIGALRQRRKKSGELDAIALSQNFCELVESNHAEATRSPNTFTNAKAILLLLGEYPDQTAATESVRRVLELMKDLSERHLTAFAENPKSCRPLSVLLDLCGVVEVTDICKELVWGDYPSNTRVHPAACNPSLVQFLADLAVHGMAPFALRCVQALRAFNEKDLVDNDKLGKFILALAHTPLANDGLVLLKSMIENEPKKIAHNTSVHKAISEIQENIHTFDPDLNAQMVNIIFSFLESHPFTPPFRGRGLGRQIDKN